MTQVMVRMQNTIAERNDERGASMVEYGFLLALVALAAIVILATFGGTIAQVFTDTNAQLEANMPGGGGGTGTGTGTN